MKGKALTVRPLRANRALRFARALAGGTRLLAPARPAGLAAPARLEMVHRLGMGGWNGRVDVTFAPVDLRLAVSLRQSLELRLWLEARAAGLGAPAHAVVSRGPDEGRRGLAGEVARAVGMRARDALPGAIVARPAREGRSEALSPARALATPPASAWEVRSWGAAPMAGPVPVRAAGEVLLRVRVAGEGAVAVPVAMPQAVSRKVFERASERTVAEALARGSREREVFLKAVRVEARRAAARTAARGPGPDRQVETLLRELLRFPERAAAAIVWNALPTATRAALGEPRRGRRRKEAWGFNPRTEAHIKPQPRRGDGMGRGVETPRAAAVPSGLGNLGGRFPGVETPGFTPAPPAAAPFPASPGSGHPAAAATAAMAATVATAMLPPVPLGRSTTQAFLRELRWTGVFAGTSLLKAWAGVPSPLAGEGQGEGTRPPARSDGSAAGEDAWRLRPLSPSLPREGGGRPRPLTSGELLLPSSRDDSAAASTSPAATWRPLEQPVAQTAAAPSTPPAEQVRLLRAASEKKVSELVKTEVASALSAASAASRLTRNDVSRIADQVYSTLGRRLTVEKERRG